MQNARVSKVKFGKWPRFVQFLYTEDFYLYFSCFTKYHWGRLQKLTPFLYSVLSLSLTLGHNKFCYLSYAENV